MYFIIIITLMWFISGVFRVVGDEQQATAAHPVSGSRDNVVARRFSQTRVV